MSNVPLLPPSRSPLPATVGNPIFATYLRYVPLALFAAFLASNTRISPINDWMLLGRWGALFALTTLVVASARRLPTWPATSTALVLAFTNVALTIPYSTNPVISLVKWGVFFLFLVLCLTFAGMIRHRDDVHRAFWPLGLFFVAFVWLTPLAVPYFRQPLLGALGNINGFLTYTNALGQFLAIFGIPVLIYRLEAARTRWQKVFASATLILAMGLVVKSGTRTGGLIMVFVLGVAFWRWKTFRGRMALPAKVLILVLSTLLIPGQAERIRGFVYKYPHASDLLDSRRSYWDATHDSFRANPLTGTGFGVQKVHGANELTFQTRGWQREQGSTYFGMLEEIGLVGSLPLFAVFLLMGTKSLLVILRSRDPVRLLLARPVLAGLMWGVSENYLLYLGNAASILVFLPFFCGQRLDQIRAHEWARARYLVVLERYRRSAAPEPATAAY